MVGTFSPYFLKMGLDYMVSENYFLLLVDIFLSLFSKYWLTVNWEQTIGGCRRLNITLGSTTPERDKTGVAEAGFDLLPKPHR